MGWLVQEDCTFSEMLEIRPVLQQKYQAFLASIESSESVSARVFSLCRARVEQIHGCLEEEISEREAAALSNGELSIFTAEEQAALVVAERLPFQHHDLLDDEVANLKSSFGDDGCVTLLTAISFFDVTARLKLTFAGEA